MRNVLAGLVPAFVLFATAPALATPPLGGDDGGFVPPSAPIKRCEEAVLLQTLKKYASCVIKCHAKASKAALTAKPFDEEACEQSCTDRFEAKAQSAIAGGGCPSCLDFP